jgi:dihydroflavonol-4-reductase
MQILVTGSTGFLGAHLCRALLNQGHKVRAFHRPSSSLRLIEDLELEHALGDLTLPETIFPAMEGIDAVFHIAAWMGSHDQPGKQYTVTVEGTRNILQAAEKAGVRRVVYTSSAAALGVPDTTGKNQEPQLIDENHAWNYRPDYYPYGYAKYLAELEIQKAVAQGLEAVIVNPTLVFGPGDIYRQSNSLVVQVAEKRLSIATEGGINCVHIADVIEGHLAALACGKTGQRYLLGGENLTHLHLLQMIAECTGSPAPGIVLPSRLVRSLVGPAKLLKTFFSFPVSPEFLRLAGYYFYYDLRKAERELGLTQHRPVKDAIAEAYGWFQQSR